MPFYVTNLNKCGDEFRLWKWEYISGPIKTTQKNDRQNTTCLKDVTTSDAYMRNINAHKLTNRTHKEQNERQTKNLHREID